MAFLDDPEFIISHIRHSCVITDDTGMCEQVILNEEVENEKVKKHRKIISFGRYSMDRDVLDFPTYPQSFDIAVSPDLRNPKSQEKGDRSRRERNAEVKCKTVSWKEGETSGKMSADDLCDVFGKREVKQDKRKTVTVSQLSRQLEESLGKPNNPFLEYSKFDGESYQGTCTTMEFSIFLTMQSEEERAIPIQVTVLGTACVQDLIGLIMYKYTSEGRDPPLKNDVKSYCLQIAEDDGEVDTDFPALDNKEQITRFCFTCLALVQNDTSPVKPVPPKPSSGVIVTVHEPQHGFSRVKVESKHTRMKQVYEKMIKKRGLKRTGKPADGDKDIDPNRFDFYANYQFQTYRVSMLQKLRPVTEIQLSVSQERIEIDPVLQPKAAKKFWGKQKFTSVNMENVVACELLEEKSNGKAQFRIVYFSQNAREFKHYDFETEANVSGEIVKRVSHIINSNSSGKRSEFLALKEKKLEKRRSFRY
ncbi:target of rapamycin complex 2 subunit MAPKAP1-like isoform X4 [Acropora muricata]|uniref:target of rapamycin complex 2 subunit MAPKAP1-like isoform X3 n=1 Tax=Acropora millepora TaxID=45264 RepID=UPI001CF55696|nr:target of rapamycin complex 2 subunit MAPKAP1-like isoform X3 [Acropora millepora]